MVHGNRKKVYYDDIWDEIEKVTRTAQKFERYKKDLYTSLERWFNNKINISRDCKHHVWKNKLEKGEYVTYREMFEEIVDKLYDKL